MSNVKIEVIQNEQTKQVVYIKINEKNYFFKEKLIVHTTTEAITTIEESGVDYFNMKLEPYFTEAQRKAILEVFIDLGSYAFSKCTIAESLMINKEEMKRLMGVALNCKVVGPRSNQWVLKVGVIDSLKNQLNALGVESKFKSTTVKEVVEKARQIARELQEEKESIENESTIQTVPVEQGIIPLRKKPALPLTPVPLKKPQKLVKT